MAVRRNSVRLYSEASIEYPKKRGRFPYDKLPRSSTFYIILPRKESGSQYAKGVYLSLATRKWVFCQLFACAFA